MNILEQYLINQYNKIKIDIDKLKNNIVTELTNKTITELISMRYTLDAKNQQSNELLREIANSCTIDTIYTFISNNSELHSATWYLKDPIKNKLKSMQTTDKITWTDKFNKISYQWRDL